MECWVTHGEAEEHLGYFAFRTSVMERKAYDLLEKLREHGHVPHIGLLHLAQPEPIATRYGNWYVLLVRLSLNEDVESFVATCQKRFRERLGYELEYIPGGMSPEQAQAYLDLMP